MAPVSIPTNNLVALPTTGPILLSELIAAFPGIPGVNSNLVGSYRNLLPSLPDSNQPMSIEQVRGKKAPALVTNRALSAVAGTGVAMNSIGDFSLSSTTDNSLSVTLSNYIEPAAQYQPGLTYTSSWLPQGFTLDVPSGKLDVTNAGGYASACNFSVTVANSYGNSASIGFTLSAPGQTAPVTGTVVGAATTTAAGTPATFAVSDQVSGGDAAVTYTIEHNPLGNASIDGSGNLTVTDTGSGQAYFVMVLAANASGSAELRYDFVDSGGGGGGGGGIGSTITHTALGSLTLSNVSATLPLASYFSDGLAGADIAYSLASNPKSNASIDGSNNLVVHDLGDGASYGVTVLASNASSSAANTLAVTDGHGPPVALGGLLGATLSNANASYALLSFFGDGVAGDSNFAFSLPTNPFGNASIVGGDVLQVSNTGTFSSYSVVVHASNASGAAETTLDFKELDSITEPGTLGSVTLSNVTAHYSLASYFTDGLSGSDVAYSLVANPHSNASIAGTGSNAVLTVVDGGTGSNYGVTVQGSNATSSAQETLSVTDSAGQISSTPMGNLALSNVQAVIPLWNFFSDRLLDKDITYSLISNPKSNASIGVNSNLRVPNSYTLSTYDIVVRASNAWSSASTTLHVTENNAIVAAKAFAAVQLSKVTAAYAMHTYFADGTLGGSDLAFSITSNGNSNATNHGSNATMNSNVTLTVKDGGIGASYSLSVMASNASMALLQTFNVTESGGTIGVNLQLGSLALSNVAAFVPLASHFSNAGGGGDIVYSLINNTHASVTLSNKIVKVVDTGVGLNYNVNVRASNSWNTLCNVMSVAESGGTITAVAALGSVALANETVYYDLLSYMQNHGSRDIVYQLTANPYGNAVISSNSLAVTDLGSGSNYTITVSASNSWNALTESLAVADSGGPIRSNASAFLGNVTLSNASVSYSLPSIFADNLGGGTDITYSLAANPLGNATVDGSNNLVVANTWSASTYAVVVHAANAWNSMEQTVVVTEVGTFAVSLLTPTSQFPWAGFQAAPASTQGAGFAAAGGYVGAGCAASVSAAGWFDAFSGGSNSAAVATATLPFQGDAAGDGMAMHVFACYKSSGRVNWIAALQQSAVSSYGQFCEAATCGDSGTPTMVFAGVMNGLQSGVGATLSLSGGVPLSSPSVLTTALSAYPAYVLGIDAATGSTLEFALAFVADIVRLAPARAGGDAGGLVVACSTASGSGNSVQYGTGSSPSSATPPSFELSDGQINTYVFLASSAGVPGTSAGLRVYGCPATVACIKTSAVDGAVFLSVGLQCANASFTVGGPTEESSTTLQLPAAVASTGNAASIVLKLDAGLNLLWAACVACDGGGAIGSHSFDVTASGDVVVVLAPTLAASFSVSTLDLGGGSPATAVSTASYTAASSFVAMVGFARLSGTNGSVVSTSALGALNGSIRSHAVDSVACGGIGGGEGFVATWSVDNGGNYGSSAYTFAHSDGTSVDQSGAYGSAYIQSVCIRSDFTQPFVSAFDQSSKPAWQSMFIKGGSLHGGIYNGKPYFSAAYDPTDGTFVYGGTESAYFNGPLSYAVPGTGSAVQLVPSGRYNSSDFAAIKVLSTDGMPISETPSAVAAALHVTGPVGNVVLWSTESSTVAVGTTFIDGTPPMSFAIVRDPLGTSTLDGAANLTVVGSPTTTPSECAVVVKATDANGSVATSFLGVKYLASVSSSLVMAAMPLVLTTVHDAVYSSVYFVTGQVGGTALLGGSVNVTPGDGFVSFASVPGGASGSECLVAVGNGGSVSYLTVSGDTLLATQTASPPDSGSLGVWDVMQNATSGEYFFRNVNYSSGEYFLYSPGDGTLSLAIGASGSNVYVSGGFSSVTPPTS